MADLNELTKQWQAKLDAMTPDEKAKYNAVVEEKAKAIFKGVSESIDATVRPIREAAANILSMERTVQPMRDMLATIESLKLPASCELLDRMLPPAPRPMPSIPRMPDPAEAISRGIRKDRKARMEKSRARQKARDQVDPFVLWAWSDKAKRKQPFDGYSYGRVDDRMIVGLVVKARLFDFVPKIGGVISEELQLANAHDHLEGQPSLPSPIRFNRAGRRHARRLLWKRRFRWLTPVLPHARKPFIAIGLLGGFLAFADKAVSGAIHLFDILKQHFFAAH